MDYFMLAARVLQKSVTSFVGLNAMSLHPKAPLDHKRDPGKVIKACFQITTIRNVDQ